MACPKCRNDKYPEECEPGSVRKEGDPAVKYCKICGYPRLSDAARRRVAEKLMQVKHLVALPKDVRLKKIDPKYLGETLDPHHRPLDELAKLRKEWASKWDENYEKAPNFYDWVGAIKSDVRVLQLTAEDRLPYVVTIKDNCLTGGYVSNKYSEYAFVLDAFGNFYAAPKQTSGETRIHHSSFMGGSPVQCAGIFFCNQSVSEHTKKIFYVKDYSGHYQPGKPEILRLKKRLVDLGQGDIMLWYYAGEATPKYKGPIKDFTGNGLKCTALREIDLKSEEACRPQTLVPPTAKTTRPPN